MLPLRHIIQLARLIFCVFTTLVYAEQNNLIPTVAANAPVITINTPNEHGLSHNRYDKFDVGVEGVRFNNDQTSNPNLRDRAASVILNEVTGAQRSELNGLMEIMGQRADLVIANPNGIT
ncbi:MAG: filamentous hemagglutinin N-terminal domain-containing protein, partial [Ottowia sp.]|nr:filamentous hemagglutinin N-terminal domain-containing protein [Ottowia sp.]